ncbi:ABC transporter ATP-binding protein/permease [Photobacterium frigidiphilum]|uniref:ABC transporter ATP-binding protein n=1 Tax=Photobacterium frigidiphilum TaxID=264736 RepID=UPI003D0FCEC0
MQAQALSSLRWLLAVSGRQQTLLFFATLCTFFQVLLNLVPAIMIYAIIDGLVNNSLTNTAVMHFALIAVGASLLRYILMFFAAIFSHHAAFQLVSSVKIQLTKRLLDLPLSFFDNNRSADLRQVIHEDVDRIELFVAHHINDLFTALFTPLFTAALLFWFDWRLAIVALIPIPLALTMQTIMYRGFEDKAHRYYQALAEMNRQSSQLIRSVAALRMFTLSDSGMKPLKSSIQGYSKLVGEWMKEASWPYALLKVCLDISLVILLPITAWMTIQQNLNLAGFVLFMMLGLTLTEPFYNLMMFSGSLNQIMQGIKRIEQVEQATLSLSGTVAFPTSIDTLTVEKVTFRFPQRDTVAVKNVSLEIQAGEKIAIVGASGSGKSTLMKILTGYYTPQSGHVSINDHPISNYNNNDFYRHIGIVMQSNYIFDATLRENLTLGNSVNDESIWNALSLAEAKGFILRQTHALETRIGGNFSRLSGGEKQRIAIARELLKPTHLFLLDEATSFFDPQIEVNMLTRLFEVKANDTFIFVTHRIAMAQKADRIAVMNQGEVIGFDTHEVLMQTCSEYQSLVAIHEQTLQYGENPPLNTQIQHPKCKESSHA